MRPSHRPATQEKRNQYERMLVGFSAANQPEFCGFLRRKDAAGKSTSYLKILANGLTHLDVCLHGTSSRNASPDALTGAILALSRDRNPTTDGSD